MRQDAAPNRISVIHYSDLGRRDRLGEWSEGDPEATNRMGVLEDRDQIGRMGEDESLPSGLTFPARCTLFFSGWSIIKEWLFGAATGCRRPVRNVILGFREAVASS